MKYTDIINKLVIHKLSIDIIEKFLYLYIGMKKTLRRNEGNK